MHSHDHPTGPADETFDVIVVGARVAGAATAMLLARAGLRTLVIDQSARGADTLSTHALMRGGVLQLSRWGLLDEIVARGTPAVRRTTFVYADERVDIGIKPTHGVDALYAPRRTVIDPLLVRAAEQAGADVRHQTAVRDLVRHDGRVVGVCATTPHGRVRFGGRLVIGADGIRSTIARLTGARLRRTGAHAAAATYGYWSDLDTDGYEWVFRPNACSGVIPTNDGQACVFASAQPARIGRGGVDVIRAIVAAGSPELASRLAAATPPAGTRTWPGQPGYFRQAHGPGWALVGDAGYFKDPIGAHGLTDALRDAELLARAVIDGFDLSDDGSSLTEALEHFEATRDHLSVPLFETVDRIAGNEWDDAEIPGLLRRLSSSMADEVETLAALDAVRVP